MKTKFKYLIYCILILILGAVIPNILTHSKYISNVDIESNVSIGKMIFEMKQQDNEPETYSVKKGEEITAKYKICNNDENDNINQMDLKYYIKIVDENKNESLPLNVSIDGYQYIKYNIDSYGNIIDKDGNVVDEDGSIIEPRELTQEKNEELQNSLETVKKGFGKISLAYDGTTKEEKEININIKCPENYTGNNSLIYKVLVIAEGISNKDFKYEETIDLNINIKEDEQTEENNSLLQDEENDLVEDEENKTVSEENEAKEDSANQNNIVENHEPEENYSSEENLNNSVNNI